MKLKHTLILALLVSCSSTPGDTNTDSDSIGGGFPFDGSGGKTDVFGRSLVGAPNPYEIDERVLADQNALDSELVSNMRARREFGWNVIFKVLEPVPLLGLENQLARRPDCEEGVVDRDLDNCKRNSSEQTCGDATSGDIGGICAWEDDACVAACDNLSIDGVPIPKIPRWQTWYGMEDISQIFKYSYAQLSPEEQLAQIPFTDQLIGEAFNANNGAIDRSKRWPLRRYTDAVGDLFECGLEQGADEADEDFDARCAADRQSQFSGSAAAGGGIARLMYSPAMVLHMMRNYGETLACDGDKLTDTWCEGPECADPPTNFSTCFKSEFPANGGNPWADLAIEESFAAGNPETGGTVIVKATWSRVGFDFELPAYDTDAEALARRVDPGEDALWKLEGDRQFKSDAEFPSRDDIYTIETKSGGLYRLTGLHAMTKELRHWVWVTLWWSDKPDSDFGEDRPEKFDELPGVWQNYKMCVVVDYTETDADPVERFNDFPSLQDALRAVGTEQGQPSWCSNPYIEREEGNARTNCIGCHQHAGSAYEKDGETNFDLAGVIASESTSTDDTPYPMNGRLRVRSTFATDYSWAFSRLDNLTELMRSEIAFKGTQDERWVRIQSIIDGEGDADAGEAVFRETTEDGDLCTDCHGDNGEGGLGPNLTQVFNQKTDWTIVHTIIEGRGQMPTWGDTLTDEELTNLFSYLKREFADEDR